MSANKKARVTREDDDFWLRFLDANDTAATSDTAAKSNTAATNDPAAMRDTAATSDTAAPSDTAAASNDDDDVDKLLSDVGDTADILARARNWVPAADRRVVKPVQLLRRSR